MYKLKTCLSVFLVTLVLLFNQNCGPGYLAKNANWASFSSLGSVNGPGVSKLRRLSNVEYKNSLSDVITYQFMRQSKADVAKALLSSEIMQDILSALPVDVSSRKLGTDQLSAFLSASRFSAYTEIASATAQQLTKDLATLKAFVGSCAISVSDMSNVDCVDAFINNFGLLVFRNPVKATELAELKAGISSWKDLVGRILVHPRFTNHFEREGELIGGNGVYKLNAFEIEARLCAVFWKSVPDPVGLAAAASGALNTPEGLKAEVKRILASPKAQETLWLFYQQWFGIARIPSTFDTGDIRFAAFQNNFDLSNYRTNVIQDGKDFLNYLTWTSKGKLEDIFRSPLIFTTSPTLASIYGVTARANSDQPPATDSTGRYKGILTRPFITSQKPSVYGETNHILRGVLITSNILGIELGEPANFGEQADAAKLVPEGSSTRSETAIKTSASACISCHAVINPAGFAFAHFDTLGRYVMVEKRYKEVRTEGQPVSLGVAAENPISSDTSLVLNGVAYTIADASTFVDAIVKSGKVHEAFARYYFRFAFGRIESVTDDLPLLDNMKMNLQNQTLQDALESLALHPDFTRIKAAN